MFGIAYQGRKLRHTMHFVFYGRAWAYRIPEDPPKFYWPELGKRRQNKGNLGGCSMGLQKDMGGRESSRKHLRINPMPQQCWHGRKWDGSKPRWKENIEQNRGWKCDFCLQRMDEARGVQSKPGRASPHVGRQKSCDKWGWVGSDGG